MTYSVRLMRKEDVPQVTEIDREAFPTQWPPPNYEHELRNRLAHHIVSYDEEKVVEKPETHPKPGARGLTALIRRLFNHHNDPASEISLPNQDYITGFAGFWILADEAHITAIATREAYRRRGIGELLLISVIEMAIELNARIVTLEVRASNVTAQKLYVKCSFTQVGVRRGYYIDNREDALIMSTADIASAPFHNHFQQLKEDYARKYGIANYQVAR